VETFAIASLVNTKKVYDVGCDHALLDIYLTLNQDTICLAMDISENALNGAIKNIKKYDLEDKIKIHKADGLGNIVDFKDVTVIISGMGTRTILEIIKGRKINDLIVQSNKDLYQLRKELSKEYSIEKETIVKEGKIYNSIIKLKKGSTKYTEFEYYVGFSEDLDYYKYLYLKYSEINKKIPKKHIKRKFKYYKLLHKLKRKMKSI
jgi:tRNA A22 N-methylase